MAARRALHVIATGALTTVQDLGRPGLAALGVTRSGAADRDALRLANRLLGNAEDEAALEVTLGGLVLRCVGGATVAVTGAPCPVSVAGRMTSPNTSVWVPDGAELRLGTPRVGLRSYVGIRGGLRLPKVLGSRSSDTLAQLGPAPLVPGQLLGLRDARGWPPGIEVAPVRDLAEGEVRLRVQPGPRRDWFTPEAYDALLSAPYEVTAASDRVGMRLTGPILRRSMTGELPSEAMVPGALQVPPSGQPLLFLADHPVTGGYPVIGVVPDADLGLAAQVRPGQSISFRAAD